MKGSITFPSPDISSASQHFSSQLARVESCRHIVPAWRSVHGSNFDNWFMANLRYHSGISSIDLSIDVRFMYGECTLMYFIQFSFFGKKFQWVYCKRFHITPLVDGSLPLFGGNTRINPFWCHPQGILNPIRATEGKFWCTIYVLKHGWTIRQMEVVPICSPTRWGSLDLKKGAPSTLSSLNHSCLPPSSGCSGPRLDPNTCQKKCQKECQNRCDIMQEYARYHVRIDV